MIKTQPLLKFAALPVIMITIICFGGGFLVNGVADAKITEFEQENLSKLLTAETDQSLPKNDIREIRRVRDSKDRSVLLLDTDGGFFVTSFDQSLSDSAIPDKSHAYVVYPLETQGKNPTSDFAAFCIKSTIPAVKCLRATYRASFQEQ